MKFSTMMIKPLNLKNEVRNYLYAMRMVVKRSFRKGTLSFGTEETFTNRHDIFVQSGFSDNADDHIKQSIYSVFADYSLHLDKFNVAVGLRYEHQKRIIMNMGFTKMNKVRCIMI